MQFKQRNLMIWPSLITGIPNINIYEALKENTFVVLNLRSCFNISAKSAGGGHEKCMFFPVCGCLNLQSNGQTSTVLSIA